MSLTGGVKIKVLQRGYMEAEGSQILSIYKALENMQALRLVASKNSALEKVGYWNEHVNKYVI